MAKSHIFSVPLLTILFITLPIVFITRVNANECDPNTDTNCAHEVYGDSVKQWPPNASLLSNGANESCYYRCNSSQDETCVSRDQICDITKDCAEGDDEHQSCDKLWNGSYCSFGKNDYCFWQNTANDSYYWSPEMDDNNEWFLRVKFRSDNNKHFFGKSATISSPLFPAIHPYHSDADSNYYNTCHVRFMYLFTWPSSELVLEVVENNPSYHKDGKIVELWRKFLSSKASKIETIAWTRVSIPLPFNIQNDFRLVFVWSATFVGQGVNTRNRQIIALDNISLSKECFGIGLPPAPVRSTPDTHSIHFDIPTNNSLKSYKLTTCGSKGRLGPSFKQCEQFYSNTPTRAAVMDSSLLLSNGTQMWTVPYTGYYTIFVRGAKGGDGLHIKNKGGNGALVRSVFYFQEGDTIFSLIGQSGTNACRMDELSPNLRSKCMSKVRAPEANITNFKKTLQDLDRSVGGAGGGGGGSYVFRLEDQSLVPLIISGGGGGGGSDTFYSQSLEGQNGRGFDYQFKGSVGSGAESGGGWFADPLANRSISGSSLLSGAEGGYVCNATKDWGTYGGFGGGGGGCISGGGGGGYQGGDSYDAGRGGQGGTSYVDKSLAMLALSAIKETRLSNDDQNDGAVTIVPQIDKCCNNGQYPCVITGQLANNELIIECICGFKVFERNECKHTIIPWTLISIIGGVCLLIVCIVIFGAIYFIKYHKTCSNGSHCGTDRNGRDASASQLLSTSSTDVQLSRLRSGHNIITEYNPNYEFGGSTCTLQDLREVPREKLTLIKALGQGAFGEVYQGFLHNMPGEITDELPVAVKTLPEYSANNQAEMDFLMEALIMSKFKHRNIVRFIGVCFEKMPRFIVLELLPGGDLKTFLRESRGTAIKPSPLVMGDILVIALDIALGCQYLEENHFIHRDIAARNCLLTSKTKSLMATNNVVNMNQAFNYCNYSNGYNNSAIVVKIADFGMARDIYRADYYRKGGKAMLPVKWMPPEAFLDGIFTSKTDVWSFGVLLWEVMSMGYMPYPGRGNQEVMQMVTAGGRLEPPNPSTPSQVYAIMTQSWNAVPDQRPSFTTIIERIGYCLQDPDVLNTKLPIFHRAPSMERDMTLMRPPPDSTDYLVPNNPCSNSNSNYSMSTEKTELLSPDTCSTFSCGTTNDDNKLLELLDDVNPPPVIPPRSGNWKETCFTGANSNQKNLIELSTAAKSNGIKSGIVANKSTAATGAAATAAQPLLLDASTLLQQPSRYVNVNVNDSVDVLNTNARINEKQVNC